MLVSFGLLNYSEDLAVLLNQLEALLGLVLHEGLLGVEDAVALRVAPESRVVLVHVGS